MTTINAWTYGWDDDQPRPALKPPALPADEAAPLIDLVERNRCSACGIAAKRQKDGRFHECLTPACAKKRNERKRLAELIAKSGERHSVRR